MTKPKHTEGPRIVIHSLHETPEQLANLAARWAVRQRQEERRRSDLGNPIDDMMHVYYVERLHAEYTRLRTINAELVEACREAIGFFKITLGRDGQIAWGVRRVAAKMRAAITRATGGES